MVTIERAEIDVNAPSLHELPNGLVQILRQPECCREIVARSQRNDTERNSRQPSIDTGYAIENLIERSIPATDEERVITRPSSLCGCLSRVFRCNGHDDIHRPDAFPQLLIQGWKLSYTGV